MGLKIDLNRTLLAGAAAMALVASATLATARPPTPPEPAPVPSTRPSAPMSETPFRFGPAGPVTIYRTAKEPDRFVVFLSGDNGWDQGLANVARKLAQTNATVVGVDLRDYLANTRWDHDGFYPAADITTLAKAVQKSLGFSRYHRPAVVGYSSGATIAYGSIVQAPEGTFQGALGLRFCPDLKTPKPMSEGLGKLGHHVAPKLGFVYEPSRTLRTPFIAIRGGAEACPTLQPRAFLAQTPGGRVIDLPGGPHGRAGSPNWTPEIGKAFASLYPHAERPAAPIAAAADSQRLASLPLVEARAAGHGDTMAILYSGDGGWAAIDQGLAAGFTRAGVPVVGFDSLRYFWTARTPEGAASDLTAVMERYMGAWGKSKVILAGYSFGADALPAIVARLPPPIRGRIRLLALVGVSKNGELEFKPGDWLNLTSSSAYAIAPVLEELKDVPRMCVYGDQEHDDPCATFPEGLIRPYRVAGDHHFDGDYTPVSDAILKAAAK